MRTWRLINTVSIVFLFLLSGLLNASPIYTIQPLIDANQPAENFQVSFNTAFFRQFSNSNPTYLLGTVGTSTAIGSLSGSNFQYQKLNSLAGLDSILPLAPLADGSALGLNYQQGAFSTTTTLTRWVNGVPSAISLSDPANPSAVFAKTFLGANSLGDIAGQYTLNGLSSIYRYNIYSSSLSIIPFPDPTAGQIAIAGLNDAGNILALNSSVGAGYRLYDPGTQTWADIGLASNASGIGSNPYLAENGSFGVSQSLADGSGLPLAYENGAYRQLLSPAPVGGAGFVARNVFGYNSSGTAIGNTGNVSGIWLNGTFLNIADLVINPQGWASFAFATNGVSLGAIDDSGRIYGTGTFNGQVMGFVLTPAGEVPEPGTFLLLGCGVVALVLYRRTS